MAPFAGSRDDPWVVMSNPLVGLIRTPLLSVVGASPLHRRQRRVHQIRRASKRTGALSNDIGLSCYELGLAQRKGGEGAANRRGWAGASENGLEDLWRLSVRVRVWCACACGGVCMRVCVRVRVVMLGCANAQDWANLCTQAITKTTMLVRKKATFSGLSVLPSVLAMVAMEPECSTTTPTSSCLRTWDWQFTVMVF